MYLPLIYLTSSLLIALTTQVTAADNHHQASQSTPQTIAKSSANHFSSNQTSTVVIACNNSPRSNIPSQQAPPSQPILVHNHQSLFQSPSAVGAGSWPVTPPLKPTQSVFQHPLSILILILAFLGFISTFGALPFSIMPSDPRAASSSSSRPSGSSSSSSRDPGASSSSKSSGSSGSSSSSSSGAKPPQPTPFITANAWMSFFLFVCLVLIILQGPLGLTGGTGFIPGFGVGAVGAGGLPGCGGYVAAVMPWCSPFSAPMAPMAPYAPVAPYMMAPQVVQPVSPPPVVIKTPPQAPVQIPQMGGQGVVSTPDGGGGYSWYANAPGQGEAIVGLVATADSAPRISISSTQACRAQCPIPTTRTPSPSQQWRYALLGISIFVSASDSLPFCFLIRLATSSQVQAQGPVVPATPPIVAPAGEHPVDALLRRLCVDHLPPSLLQFSSSLACSHGGDGKP